jgi:hypothetical protein
MFCQSQQEKTTARTAHRVLDVMPIIGQLHLGHDINLVADINEEVFNQVTIFGAESIGVRPVLILHAL